ncbi:MAG: hypothetical protein ACT4QB_06950 [Gammaproteobacteria bacterium]
MGFRAGSAYREGEKQFRSAVLDPALAAVKGITRPFVEPIISNGPQVVSNAASGIADFGRGVVGAEPRSSLVAPPVAAPQAAPTARSVIPDAQAKSVTKQQGAAGVRPTRPTTPGVANLFSTLDPTSSSAALDATDPGTAVIQGRFAGSAAPETRSYTQQGVADAGKRLNVVKGLFSGVSPETEQALSEARNAAAARGDHEAVERSYLTSPEQRAEYDAGKAEKAILKRLPTLPAPELGNALKGLTDLRIARVGKVPTLDQVKAARAGQLLTGNPTDLTASDKLLFGQRPPANQRPQLIQNPEVGEDGYATGGKTFYTLGPDGQAVPVDLPGAKSAQGAGRPADYPDAYQGRMPDGKPGWFVKREGKTYQVSE